MLFLALFVFVCSLALTAGLTPPTIIFSPKDYDDPDQALINQKFTLSCEATGSLPMTFKWKKSGKDFETIEPYRVVRASGRLSNITIKSLTPYDDGKYQCLVSNPAGGTFSRKLRMKVTATSAFKQPQTAEESVNVTVGRSLHLACPEHTTGGHNDFGAIHSWGRKLPTAGPQLQMRNNIAQLSNGDLFFTFVRQEDINKLSGYPFNLRLQCFVQAGNTIYYSLMYVLKVVKTDNSLFAPQFANGGEPLQSQTAVQGKEKFLHCVASGSPAPKTRWFRVSDDGKTNEIINEKDGFLIAAANYGRVLHIPKVYKEVHEPGHYKCEVSNGQGNKLVSKLIKITVYVPPEWIVKPPPMKTVPVLGDAELVCEANGNPAPKYDWYHNGTKFTSDTELAPHIIVTGNTLLIKKIDRRNEGVFQCAVENDWGMIVSSTWLRVEARAPKIRNFGPFYVFRGTKAVLACDSNAAPVASHDWSKNDKFLTMSGRYSLGPQNSLVIENVTSADEGKYTCKATNDLGVDEASNTATVYDRTEIFRPPKKNMVITLKKPLDLHCEASADARLRKYLTYKWLKDGRQIDYDSRVRWIENQNILKIEDANVNDGAMYTCIAFTNAPQRSEDRATAIADVKGVPFPPSDLKITNCYNRTTTITWKKGKDNDAPITHFVVEQESTYLPEEWEVIVNISDPTKTSHTLMLTAWANLTFRMRAINKIGPSRASMPTAKGQCVTSVFRPLMYPKNFRGVPGKANELDIAWTPMTKLEANAPGLHYILKYVKVEDKGKKGAQRTAIIKDPKTSRYSIPDAGYYKLWEFQIMAKNDVGEGPVSDVVRSFSGQDAPTSKPENVKIGKVAARYIELSWDRVIVTRGSVDGYNIYYWGQSKLVQARRRKRAIPVGAKVFKALSTTYDSQNENVTGLKPYTSYSLAIKAFNSGGEGPESDEVKFDTLQDVPGPVSDFKAQAFSSFIFANWGEPADKNGILQGYFIGALEHEDKEPIKPVSQVKFSDLPTNKFEHLFETMKPETRYVVYIRAKTIIGPGPVMKFDVKTIAPAKPTKPRAPLADAHSTTAVNITFLFGEKPGGYPLEFMIKYREKATNGSFQETGWFNHLEKRWAVVDNLAENRLYQFVTVGRNKLGESPDSPPTDARPVPAVASGKREATPFYRAPWFIILIVLVILLLLVVLIVLLYRRRRGAKYPVGKREKERAAILDHPDEEEGMDMSKMDDNPPPYPSQGSLDKPNMSDDNDSLDGYGEGPEFKEDGSFIEEYGDDKKKLSDDRDKSASATFV